MRTITSQGPAASRDAHASRRQAKWELIAIELDRNDAERREFKAKADEIALRWATRPSADFSSPGIKGEVAALMLACKKAEQKTILAGSFREAADICDNGRARSIRVIADHIESGMEMRMSHFLEGLASS